MYKFASIISLSVFLLSIGQAQAAGTGVATLRISCDDESQGAEIFINGQFKGECSLDVDVRPGTVEIRAVNSKKQIFEQSVRLTAGTAKRIDIEFGAQEREEAEQAARVKYDGSWVSAEATWWQMPASESYSCSDLKERVDSRIKKARGFSCDCVNQQVQHPAWQDYDETKCTATFEANLVENRTDSFWYQDGKQDQSTDQYMFRIR
ncbi:hypothetical protein D3C79_329630 [compost metagenome]